MPADYTVSLRCATNDGETAIGACHLCRDPICDLCIATHEGDALVCRRCAYQGAETKAVPAGDQHDIDVDRRTQGEWRLVLVVLALSAMDFVLTANWLAFAMVTLVGLPFILIQIRFKRVRLYLAILLYLNVVLVLYDLFLNAM
jgi:ribosomal protein L40E